MNLIDSSTASKTSDHSVPQTAQLKKSKQARGHHVPRVPIPDIPQKDHIPYQDQEVGTFLDTQLKKLGVPGSAEVDDWGASAIITQQEVPQSKCILHCDLNLISTLGSVK